MLAYSTTTTSAAVVHNGPICQACDSPYVGAHTCSAADLLKAADRARQRADELTRMARERLSGPPRTPFTPGFRDMSGCPCRPENGGSGVCGCILGGPQVTC